jgi:hypothetical protein
MKRNVQSVAQRFSAASAGLHPTAQKTRGGGPGSRACATYCRETDSHISVRQAAGLKYSTIAAPIDASRKPT